jgi:GxxExxY protein
MLIDDGTDGLTYRIIGCAMRVHNALGPGLKEVFYENAVGVELKNEGIPFVRQKPVEVYLDQSRIGVIILDLLVAEQVIVEIKALKWLITDDEIGQVITYLTATELDTALLINFGRRSLNWQRILPPKKVTDFRQRINRYVVNPKEPPL